MPPRKQRMKRLPGVSTLCSSPSRLKSFYQLPPACSGETMSPGKKVGKKVIAVSKSSSRVEPATALLDISAPRPTKVETPGNARRQEGRYVYGVIESHGQQGSFGHSNLGGGSEEVYTVHHGDLAAVVSRAPVFIFDPTR